MDEGDGWNSFRDGAHFTQRDEDLNKGLLCGFEMGFRRERTPSQATPKSAQRFHKRAGGHTNADLADLTNLPSTRLTFNKPRAPSCSLHPPTSKAESSKESTSKAAPPTKRPGAGAALSKVKVKIDGDVAAISMKYDQQRIAALKQAAAGSARWDPGAKVWRVPLRHLATVRRSIGIGTESPPMWEASKRELVVQQPPLATPELDDGWLVLYDLETTGLGPVDKVHIVEVAAIAIHVPSGYELGFERRVRPPVAPSRGAVQVHGLSKRELSTAQPFKSVARELSDGFLGTLLAQHLAPIYLMAHNGDRFDHPILLAEMRSADVSLPSPGLYWVDTLRIFGPLYPEAIDRRLETLYCHVTGERQLPNAHSAMGDVLALRTLVHAAAQTVAESTDSTCHAMRGLLSSHIHPCACMAQGSQTIASNATLAQPAITGRQRTLEEFRECIVLDDDEIEDLSQSLANAWTSRGDKKPATITVGRMKKPSLSLSKEKMPSSQSQPEAAPVSTKARAPAPVVSKEPPLDEESQALLKAAELNLPLPNGWNIFEHQKQGIRRLLCQRRVIVAFDMGLGKTVTSLVAARAFERVLGTVAHVICPSSMQGTWQREAMGVGLSRLEVHTWGLVPLPFASPFVLILDEAHYMQNYASKRTKAALALAQSSNCKMLALLTGTPLKNGRPINLLPLLAAVGHPLAKDRAAYENRYCGVRKTPFGRNTNGATNMEELRERTVDVILRRTKAECLDLPPKVRRTISVDPDSHFCTEYNRTLKEMKTESTRAAGKSRAFGAEALQRLTALRQIASSAKVGAACELAMSVVESGGAVVVFACFVATATAIQTNLQSDKCQVELILGTTSAVNRQSAIDRFQAGTSNVFVATFGCGGVGITLTSGSDVVLVDRPWTPGDAAQAEDRCHRTGTKGTVTCHWLQAFDVDIQMDKLIESKQSNIVKILPERRKVVNNDTKEDTKSTNISNADGGGLSSSTSGEVKVSVAKDLYDALLCNRTTSAIAPSATLMSSAEPGMGGTVPKGHGTAVNSSAPSSFGAELDATTTNQEHSQPEEASSGVDDVISWFERHVIDLT